MRLARATLLASLLVGALATPMVDAIAQTLPNGIAAGDVEKDRAILWARSTALGELTFEWSTDPAFKRGVRRRRTDVTDVAVPVKVDVRGLQDGTTYHYRVTDAAGASKTGRFKTPARRGRRIGVRFGVSGDSRGDLAPFPSMAGAVSRDLDLFVELGDTIYADVESPILPGVAQVTTLPEFRLKHEEILSLRGGLNTLADLRATTALLVTIDDHEVTNDFAGGALPASDPRFDPTGAYINETALYDAGLTAFLDFHPLRDERFGATGDPRTAAKRRLYRTRRYGSDAQLFLIDARSFRDPGLVPANPADPLDVLRFLSESFDPRRTMLGDAQLQLLQQDLLEAQRLGVTWKFVMVPEPIQNLGVVAASDRFEGYAAERNELLAFIADQGIDNVVFVAADIHGTLVNDVTFQRSLGAPQEETGAFEITTGAIAYAAPFGPTVVELAHQLGLISDLEKAFYDSLPLPGKEAFVAALVDAQLLPLGYDPVGLSGSSIPATLLNGGWTATHTWGYTEFAVDAATSRLTVTTFGLEPSDLTAAPFVVSEFTVDAR